MGKPVKQRVSLFPDEQRRNHRQPISLVGSIGGVRINLVDLSITGIGCCTMAQVDVRDLKIEKRQDTTLEFCGEDGQQVSLPVKILRVNRGTGQFGAAFSELTDREFAAIEKLMFPHRGTTNAKSIVIPSDVQQSEGTATRRLSCMNARLGNILYWVGLIGAAISIFYAVVTVWVYRSGESLLVISGGFVTLEDTLSAVAIGMALAVLSWGAGVAARLFWDTEVRIFLPRAEENVTPDEAEQEKELKRERKQSILILEDDPDFCSFAVGALERLGYRVLEAADANAAMRVLEQEAGSKTGRVDLLLSDVVLPGGVSGPECAIKAKDLYPQLKVVFMSGNTAGYHMQDKIPGFEETLLTKPFRLNNLAVAMYHALAA